MYKIIWLPCSYSSLWYSLFARYPLCLFIMELSLLLRSDYWYGRKNPDWCSTNAWWKNKMVSWYEMMIPFSIVRLGQVRTYYPEMTFSCMYAYVCRTLKREKSDTAAVRVTLGLQICSVFAQYYLIVVRPSIGDVHYLLFIANPVWFNAVRFNEDGDYSDFDYTEFIVRCIDLSHTFIQTQGSEK